MPVMLQRRPLATHSLEHYRLCCGAVRSRDARGGWTLPGTLRCRAFCDDPIGLNARSSHALACGDRDPNDAAFVRSRSEGSRAAPCRSVFASVLEPDEKACAFVRIRTGRQWQGRRFPHSERTCRESLAHRGTPRHARARKFAHPRMGLAFFPAPLCIWRPWTYRFWRLRSRRPAIASKGTLRFLGVRCAGEQQ